MKTFTFENLREYINAADRDNIGMHQTKNPGIRFHIFDDNFTIIIGSEILETLGYHGFKQPVTIGKIVFTEDEVIMYESKICDDDTFSIDYDHYAKYQYSDDVSDVKSELYSSNIIDTMILLFYK